ncbi:MAG TPA: hypothetical protein VGH49_00825 [Xanthobacteraceae bacterium]
MSGRIIQYVGGGVGIVASQSQVAVFVAPGGVPRFTVRSGNATQATILSEVGLTIALDPRWSVVPAYRFQHVFTNSGAFGDEANIYKLGIRYSF